MHSQKESSPLDLKDQGSVRGPRKGSSVASAPIALLTAWKFRSNIAWPKNVKPHYTKEQEHY